MLNKLKSKSLLNRFLWILLFAEIALIFYVNITRSPVNIDSDSAKLFVHAIEMSKNGTYLIPGWKYITTLELDCSLLLAVPLYNITKDIYLSFSIANMVFLALLLYSVYRISKSWGSEIYFLLAAMLICIPYEIDSLGYMNMLFFNGSQYIIKVTLPVMLTSILSNGYNIKEKSRIYHIENVFFIAVFLILLFISSLSSGIYVLACGIVPVIAACFLWRIYDRQKQRKDFFVISAVAVVAAAMGFALNILMDINAKGNSMVLCTQENFFANTMLCIGGFFKVFCAVSEEAVPVMSYTGINILCRILFASSLIVCAFVALGKLLKRKLDDNSAMLLAVFIWNIFVLCVCDTRYNPERFEYRYHLIGIIPLMCIAIKLIYDYIREHEKYVYILGIAVMLCAVAVLNLTSYRVVVNEAIGAEYSEFCSINEKYKPENMYFLNDSRSAEICRLMDIENKYYSINKDGNIETYDYYEKYDGMPADFKNSLLLDRKDLGEEPEIFGETFVRIDEAGGKFVYRLKD